MEGSRILRSTCCSSSSAFSFSRDNVCLPGPAFSPLRPEMSMRCVTSVWARQESNLHATGYEPDALTVELRAPGAQRVARAVACAHHEGDTAQVRTLALLVALVPSLAFADDSHLSPGTRRPRS